MEDTQVKSKIDISIDPNNESDTPRLKNISYLGRTWDITTVDPLNIPKSAKGPLALRSDQELVLSEDGQVMIPKATDYTPGTSGGEFKETKMVFTAYDYQSSFEQSFSFNVGKGKKASFGASESYNKKKQETGSSKAMFTHVDAIVQIYKLAYSRQQAPNVPLDAKFSEAVETLPASTASAYQAFIEHFGTHYSAMVIMGGRAYQETRIHIDTYSNLISQGIDVSLEAKASFKADFSAKAGAKTSNQEKYENETQDGRESIYTNGGTLNSNIDTWASSVKEDPVPFEMNLYTLDTLLTGDYFPDDPDIDIKRITLKKHIDAYIEKNTKKPAINIRFADGWDTTNAWTDKGSGADSNNEAWYRPLAAEGYFIVNYLDYRQNSKYDRSPYGGTIVVQDLSGDALKKPSSWKEVRKESHNMKKGAFWVPIAPSGYRAVGMIAIPSHDNPMDIAKIMDSFRCIKSSLLVDANIGKKLWDNKQSSIFSSSYKHASTWEIVPATKSGLDLASFYASPHHDKPEGKNNILYCLDANQL